MNHKGIAIFIKIPISTNCLPKAYFTVAAWYQFDQFCLQNNHSAAEKL